MWTIWTWLSTVPRKAIKFDHSLTHWPIRARSGVSFVGANFYHCNCCAVYTIVSYKTATYLKSIVQCNTMIKHWRCSFQRLTVLKKCHSVWILLFRKWSSLICVMDNNCYTATLPIMILILEKFLYVWKRKSSFLTDIFNHSQTLVVMFSNNVNRSIVNDLNDQNLSNG